MVDKKSNAAARSQRVGVATAKQPKPDGTPRVVAAVAVAVRNKDQALSRAVEDAMRDAILGASEEGVTDPDKVRARMLAARKQAVADYNPQQAAPETPAPAPAKARTTVKRK